jgi:hypothetical protein
MIFRLLQVLVGIVNMELRENMELACPPTIRPPGAQRTSRIGRSRVVGRQVESCTPVGERRASAPTRRPATFGEAA